MDWEGVVFSIQTVTIGDIYDMNSSTVPLVVAVPRRISQWECRKYCERHYGEGAVRWQHTKATANTPAMFSFNNTKDAMDFAAAFLYSIVEDTLRQVH